MRRGKAIGWTLLLGLVAWALVGRGLVNYDTLYALVWGRDLTHGTLPDYDVSLAPTPHPLATLAGAVLSVLGADGVHRPRRSSLPSSSSAPWAGSPTAWARRGSTLPPGRWRRRSSSRAGRCSTSARAPTSTSPTSRSCSERCWSRPADRRAGAPVLALLGVAGPHPARGVAVLGGLPRVAVARRRARPAAVGAGRRRAAAVGARRPRRHRRPAALADRHARHRAAPAPHHGARRRPADRPAAPGRDPARARALRRRRRRAAGAAPSCARARRSAPRPASSRSSPSACSPRRACRSSARYLLAPAAILAIFCGAGAFGWAELPRGHPWRRRWAWFGALTLVGLVAFIPPQVDRIGDLRDALRIQDAHPGRPARARRRADPCTPVTVPNHRPVPLLALWLDVDPERIAVAQEQRPRSGTYVVPASAARRAPVHPRPARRRPAHPAAAARLPAGRGATRRGAPSRAAGR